MASRGEPGGEEEARWREWLSEPTPAEGRFDRAPRLSHPETVRSINERTAAVLLDITAQRFEWETRLTSERLSRWHRTLFGSLFPTDETVGRIRPRWREVAYRAPVYDAQAEAIRRIPVTGTPGAEVHGRLEAAFAAFGDREAAPE